MEAKHTPGPWSWNERGTVLSGVHECEGGQPIASQVLCIDLPEFMEPADKALIAAAPFLLRALWELLDQAEDDCDDRRLSPAVMAAHEALKLATSKA